MKPVHRGFTLIEMMVVLAILASLLAAGMPFTRNWALSNQQMQTRNVVQNAVAEARALALRNAGQAASDAAATELQLTVNADGTQTLGVFPAGAANAAWTATLPTNAAVQLLAGGALTRLTCVAFDNRGQRLAGATGCTTSALPTSVAIGWPGGSTSADAPTTAISRQDMLNVDLL